MRKIRHLGAALFFAFSFLALSPDLARAQVAVSYLFLETIDSNGKPVAGAALESPRYSSRSRQTDDNGRLQIMDEYRGARPFMPEFTITKSGFFPFQDLGVEGGYYGRREIKIELLKIPQNKDERKALGNEQQKREFFQAIQNRDVETVRKLLKVGVKADLTTADLRGVTAPQDAPALVYAAALGDVEILETLLRAGTRKWRTNKIGRLALGFYLDSYPFGITRPANEQEKTARLRRYEEGVKILLKAGADTTDLERFGTNALILAAQKGYAEVVRILLAHGLPVNAKDGLNYTALLQATSNGYSRNEASDQFETIKVLLAAGANPNLLGLDGGGGCTSPLMNAVSGNDAALVKLLLDNRADINLTCPNGQNAFRRTFTDYRYFSKSRQDEIRRMLIEAGAKPEFTDDVGRTNLMYAVIKRDAEAVKFLLDNGASVNARDITGETALLKSVSFEIVNLLLKNGADPNVVVNRPNVWTSKTNKINDCTTPLINAARAASGDEELRTLEILVRGGAQINFACEDGGETALTNAARSMKPEAVKKLIELGADASGAQGGKALQYARETFREYKFKETELIIKILEEAGAK